MSIVIVTRNQYIIAEKIHHITLDERKEYHDVRNPKGKLIGTTQRTFNISVIYTPDSNTNGRNDRTECNVHILTKVDAYKVYRDLIQQIREQSPDQLFLDKVLENLLTPDDIAKINNEPPADDWALIESEEIRDDRSAKKARKPRKAKRSSKKVLRKSR